ncbi:MAG: amidase, partial [Pseudomonadales bacterium]
AGEGARVFVSLDNERSRARADQMDRLRADNMEPSPWAGIPISVKDLFDVAGQQTRAGSTLLDGVRPATATALAIGRLEQAGFVIVGRTNMTEFAYSGIGINPHYGTPLNPYQRSVGRIPGGSSCGAAISVTDEMAAAGIGSDTGGSCRIPAALCGITGYKPTASRIPLTGVYPLSKSLDSVGPLAPSVSCCAVLDDIMAGGRGWEPDDVDSSRLNLAVLDHYVTSAADDKVMNAFEQALVKLSAAGVALTPVRIPEIERLPEINARGGIAAAEAFDWHRTQLEEHRADYDPRVGGRIQNGADISAVELRDLHAARTRMIEIFEQSLSGFDALLSPTVPVIAPRIDEFEHDEDYLRLNLLLLRNPSLFNFLDGCAISIPIHEPGAAPVGLMLAAPAGTDRHLFEVARAIEAVVVTVVAL